MELSSHTMGTQRVWLLQVPDIALEICNTASMVTDVDRDPAQYRR